MVSESLVIINPTPHYKANYVKMSFSHRYKWLPQFVIHTVSGLLVYLC